MYDETWNRLLYSIRHGRCIPFLGAGASSPPIPTGKELAERLTKRFDTAIPEEFSADLTKVTQFIEINERMASRCAWRGRSFLIQILEEEIYKNTPNEEFEPNSVHRNLAVLPWQMIVTTNYDCLMSRALEEVQKRPHSYSLPDQQVGGSSPDFSPSHNYPLIVHAHGILSRPALRPEHEIVITESDYYKYLANMAAGVWRLPMAVQKELASSHYLFIGYSLRDWTFRLLFYALGKFLQRDHFALIFAPREDNDHGVSKYAATYLHQFVNATIFFGDADTFTSELRYRWDQYERGGEY